MGAVTGMLGLNGGANGTGFAAPSRANIVSPVTADQATTAYNQQQQALQQQQAFLQATQAQNGLGNQTAVYNQLQNVAAGQGPNPAQAMLNQATGANTANQAALMAGQRGAGANVGLMARQAAQQGAANQQNAAGQAATMQAQQSLGALQGMGNMANQQAAQQQAAVGQNTGASLAEQQTLLNSIAGQNQANVGMQSSINQANAGLAGSTMGMMGSAIGGAASGIGAGLMLAAKGGAVPNYQDGGPVSPAPMPAIPQVAAPTAVTSAGQGPKSKMAQYLQSGGSGIGTAGKVLGLGIASGLKGLFGSSTPMPAYPNAATSQMVNALNDPNASDVDKESAIQNYGDIQKGASLGPAPSTPSNIPMTDSGEVAIAHGGKVPAMVSPGEVYLPPKDVKDVAKGKKQPMDGERIPGKAKVKGAKNSYANDIVPKTLEEGGIVLPRSVTQAKDAPNKAAEFVRAILAKQGLK